ncbi:hypothetical protein [Bacillus sp. ISL-7]|uniref:hypothetical protein n=1 Tax=Bacillus sp. ISL-7 TaxID=2819136 RepID=UPI001BE70A7B|nr:hypothetical protein [Bacillus sp. ISL-7]MBT2735156.1 hypothetical protein [Bacillus sp. ISL-7]
MVLDYSKATNQQLLIILLEDCPISFKFKEAFELQNRKEKSKSQKVSCTKRMAAYSGKTYRINL